MRKVKCSNGHFFDADRFETCPSCGAEAIGQVTPMKSQPVDRASMTQPLLPPAGIAPVPNTADTPSSPGLHNRCPSQTQFNSGSLEEIGRTAPPSLGTSTTHQKLLNTEEIAAQDIENPITGALSAAIEATASKSAAALPKTVAFYDIGEVEPPVGWLVCVHGAYIGHAFACKAGRNRIGRNLDMDICLSEDSSISRDTHAVIIYEPKKRIFYLQAGSSTGLTYHNSELIFDHSELHSYDKVELGKAEFLFFALCGEQFTWDDYMGKS